MFKKIVSAMFTLLLCFIVFAGCSVFEVNKQAYYQQTVAEVVYSDGSKHQFTKKDLLEAYNNYGYQYAENGTSAQDAITQTINAMIERHLLIEDLKSNSSIDPTQEDINYITRQVHKSINNQLLSIEDEVRKDWEMVVEEGEASTEKDPLRAAYEDYKPTVERVPSETQTVYNDVTKETYEIVTKYKLIRVEEKEEVKDTTNPGEWTQIITDEDISAEAWNRYIKLLQDGVKEEGLTLTDEAAFQREQQRLYKLYEENFYLTEYQKKVATSVNINAAAVVENYKNLYRRDYERYANNKEAYHAAMANDPSSVYYHPNSGNEYMWVTHILLSFSDSQKAEIELIKNRYGANSLGVVSPDKKTEYEAALQRVYDKTRVKYEDHKGIVREVSVEQAYNDILYGTDHLGNPIGVNYFNSNFQEKAKAFNNYIYKYNDDPGIMNSEFAYVVNLDTDVEDKMVKEFANESRELFTKGTGSVSKPVLTEFGYHIIMNLGPVENIVSAGNINSLTWERLYDVKLQPSSEKTFFHLIYDNVNNDETIMSSVINNQVKTLKLSLNKINYYTDAFKDLYGK